MSQPGRPSISGSETPFSLLHRIFCAWERQGIHWAELSDPASRASADPPRIDIVVEPLDLEAASRMVDDAVGAWQVLERRSSGRACSFVLVGRDDSLAIVRLALHGAVEREGRFIASAAFVLATRQPVPGGGWVVGEGCRSASLLLARMYRDVEPNESELRAVRAAAATASDQFRATLEHAIGPELGSALQAACVDAAPSELARLTRSVRRAARDGRRGPREWLLATIAAIGDFLRPRRGGFVVLVGPDGSGKTTMATGLIERLEGRLFTRGRYLRKTFGLLPRHGTVKQVTARLLRGPHAPVEQPANTRHSAMVKPQPTLRALLYPTYQALDMLLSRLKLRAMRARGELLVFDRFFYDCYLQSGSRNVPGWFLDLLSYLVPTPDIAIYVDRDAEEIYARKPELTLEELQRQQGEARRLLARKDFACILDGREGVAATVEMAVDAVIRHHLQKRLPGARLATAAPAPAASTRSSPRDLP